MPIYYSLSSELQHLKEDEIAGRMFEDEYNLAMAVIKAVDARAERCGY